jgi:hypothetical protein
VGRRIDAANTWDELEYAWDLLRATDEYQVLGLHDTEMKAFACVGSSIGWTRPTTAT